MRDRILADMAGIIVAGGLSRRMGRNKALIPWRGKPLIAWPLELFAGLFGEVLVVARDTRPYAHFGYRVVTDAFPEQGALVGLYSGLAAAASSAALFAACDMPCIEPALASLLAGELAGGAWAVVPESPAGIEPLLAVYSRRCLPAMEELIRAGDLRVRRLYESVPTVFVSPERVATVDPRFRSFVNLNTPAELEESTPDGERREVSRG
jgi:molybdopterin-guanine dinucleotide biosynthesis protein A